MAITREITLLIADDSEEMRETLKTLLTFNEKIRVVGEAADGKEAVTKVLDLKPDLVLMDVNMGVMGESDGLWATQEISIQRPQTGIIIISVQKEADYMRKAMAAGARDYLIKPFDSDELFKTIENVAEKERAKWDNLPIEAIVSTRKAGEGRIISIFSPKGGVGKSVVTVNLAVEVYKRTKKRVLIIDLDLQFGDIALLLNVSPKATIADIVDNMPQTLDAEYVDAYISDSVSGVRVLAAPLKPEYAETVTPQVIESILDVVKHEYEYIFIDTVPSFAGEVLIALDHSNDIFLIVAPDFLALKNVTLGLAVLDTLNYASGKIHLILNRVQSLSQVKLKDAEKGLQKKIILEIPSDSELVGSSINRGQPFVLSHPASPVAKAISELADMLIDNEDEAKQHEESGKKKFGGIFKKR